MLDSILWELTRRQVQIFRLWSLIISRPRDSWMSLIKKEVSSHVLKKMICHLIRILTLFYKFKSNQCTCKNSQCTRVTSDPFIKHNQIETFSIKTRWHDSPLLIKTKPTVQIPLTKTKKIWKKFKAIANRLMKKVFYWMNRAQVHNKKDKFSKKMRTPQLHSRILREISRQFLQMKWIKILLNHKQHYKLEETK